MREKVSKNVRKQFHYYTKKQTIILDRLRLKSLSVLEQLNLNHIPCFIYGSPVRGDVHEKSDIDIFIPMNIASYKLEVILDSFGLNSREITQATPNHTPKILYNFMDNITISVPLIPILERDINFYSFSGKCNYNDLMKDKFFPGVNKKLQLIIPNKARKGYEINQVVGEEKIVADILKTDINIIYERVRVLTKRDETGRKGIFIKRELSPNDHVEKVFKELVESNPYVKKLYKSR